MGPCEGALDLGIELLRRKNFIESQEMICWTKCIFTISSQLSPHLQIRPTLK